MIRETVNRLLLILPLLILLHGCGMDGDITNGTTAAEAPISFVSEVRDGELYIEDEKGRYRLADDALDYRVVPSPKGSWIAVETMLLSNLTVVRFYKKGSDGRYRHKEPPDLSNIWERAAEEMGFDADDLRYPRVKFLRWEGEKRASLNLSAAAAEKRIDRNVTVTLP